MNDPDKIYLQPECCADPAVGRLWSETPAPEDCEYGHSWTEYVLACSLDESNEIVNRLRGQLQNCINHLERAKRKTHRGQFDECIQSANRALYETAIKGTAMQQTQSIQTIPEDPKITREEIMAQRKQKLINDMIDGDPDIQSDFAEYLGANDITLMDKIIVWAYQTNCLPPPMHEKLDKLVNDWAGAVVKEKL